MKHEIKISLPVQKQACAVFFAVMLSLVRGVTYSSEIGIALEAPMAILAASFCADIYTQEITGKRSEIWRLCPIKRRMYCIYRRIVIQEVFLLSVAVLGYGLFFLFQNPRVFYIDQNITKTETYSFFIYFASIAVTLAFWGLLSNLLSCLFRNIWIGIGGCLILWLIINSSVGDRYLGIWNIFAVMKRGHFLYAGSVSELLEYAKGIVWDFVTADSVQAKGLEKKYLISAKQYTENGIQMRILNKEKPDVDCKSGNATLEDAYIYLTNQ